MANRNIFIVGGTSGIGLEIVKALLDRGDRVFVGSRNESASGDVSHATHLPLDVTAPDIDLDPLPDTLQGVVYCPGTIRLRPFQRLSPTDFTQDYQINLLGAVRVLQGCLARLKKSSAGAAVVLFSTVAVKTGMPFHASIASAKGAVEGLTRSLAAELAPRIRVNALALSLTDTPLAQDLLSSDERRKASAERHPLKRIGTPAEVAGFVTYLLSDTASWITGQIIPVDGGLSALRTFR
jgi:NAD(P)-dependent dehydrogenase (short-subunit alcohol dehydrogenase family)